MSHAVRVIQVFFTIVPVILSYFNVNTVFIRDILPGGGCIFAFQSVKRENITVPLHFCIASHQHNKSVTNCAVTISIKDF